MGKNHLHFSFFVGKMDLSIKFIFFLVNIFVVCRSSVLGKIQKAHQQALSVSLSIPLFQNEISCVLRTPTEIELNMLAKKKYTFNFLGKKSVRYVSLLSNRRNSIKARVRFAKAYACMYIYGIDAVAAAVISTYHFFNTHHLCSRVRMFLFSLFCLQNGGSILKSRRRQRNANIFNSKQHFSVKCQLIDFFHSFYPSYFLLIAVSHQQSH